jgi:hypothetical protein
MMLSSTYTKDILFTVRDANCYKDEGGTVLDTKTFGSTLYYPLDELFNIGEMNGSGFISKCQNIQIHED